MQRKSLLLAAGPTVLICIITALILLPGEPSYRGIRLTSWLDIVCPLSGNSAQQQAEGEKAIRQMGADAFPWLLTWLKAKDGPFDRWFSTKIYPTLIGLSLAHWVDWRPVADRNFKAIFGLKALGRAANPAIPDLLEFVDEQTNTFEAWRGVRALSAIGTEQALDAVMSLQGSRSYFSREALLSTFLSSNPRMPEYVWRKYQWGYPRKLRLRQIELTVL